MQRHRQKDEEAGGEGAGVLNTRKRMWKDHDGNIVTKRPNLGKKNSTRRSSPSSDHHARSLSTSTADSVDEAIHTLTGDAPISPPISSTQSSGSDDYARRSSNACDTATDPTFENWVFPPLELSPAPEPHSYPEPEPLAQDTDRFWSNAGGPQTASLRNLSDDVPYDDIFNPDTASSFNMPFTTMNNYNWLFDVDLGAAATQQFTASPPDILSGTFPATHVDQAAPDSQPSTHTFPTGVTTEHTPAASELATLSTNGSTMTVSAASISQSQSNPSLMHDMSMAHSATVSLPSLEPQHSTLTDGHQSVASGTPGRSRIMNGATSPNTSTDTATRDSLSVRQAQLGIDFERPMSSMNGSANLPVIDEIARAQVLDVIEAARPVTPDGLYISRNHPLLSLSSLQTYCDLYFTRFNTAYPLIHQPTFDASCVETVLLVSVLLLGATYCEKDAHQLAVCIHDVLRPQIFAHAGFNAKPDLWVLQTILLVECFGKSRAGQKQHDMAHLFHGLLINLIRRSDCQTIRTSMSDDCSSGDLENDWRRWAEAEQKKRLAYLCFMWDVQHAVLFCQSLCMSAFELRSNLPCDQQLWEADSAELWQRIRKRYNNTADSKKPSNPPLFLSLIKAYLHPGGPPSRPRNLNALSRVLLLHGLMSISWDMKRRDQTSLGIVGGGTKQHPIGDWKSRMAASYDVWRTHFDEYCEGYLSLFCSSSSTTTSTTTPQNKGANELLRSDFVTWRTAHSAIHHAAHALLHADFLDLQIFAGARHILGRPVGRADYVRSARVVKGWANAGSEADRLKAARAARHAALLIEEGARGLEGFDAGGLFHYPWCLYLATVVVWCWWQARPVGGPTSEGEEAAQQGGRSRRRRTDSHGGGDGNGVDGAEDDGLDDDEDADDGGDEEMVWDSQKEMVELIGCMAGAAAAAAAAPPPSSLSEAAGEGCDQWLPEKNLELLARSTRPPVMRRRTSGLAAAVARHLGKVRWAVVHDGMMVLRGLVPWRMIGGAQEGCV
ncbi:Transcription factor fungi [Macrophomina phaseolina MS6]|uniref:Transcription factor fungi n=1 Tax=Macrophomina phaseolina (strain MS6) TaxID=1126212 RepID=K2SZN8_MACPH|nr:Transcription factor fungi [Macrophomina phaseolina MS6]